MRIVSVGEILWDVIGNNEYLGGAPLNFAAHAQKLGHEVFPLSAVGADARGHKAIELLKERGMSTEFVQVLPDKVVVMAETADLASEIDLERAQEARHSAERALEAGIVEPVDLAQARAELQAALVRIRVAERRHREGPHRRG